MKSKSKCDSKLLDPTGNNKIIIKSKETSENIEEQGKELKNNNMQTYDVEYVVK